MLPSVVPTSPSSGTRPLRHDEPGRLSSLVPLANSQITSSYLYYLNCIMAYDVFLSDAICSCKCSMSVWLKYFIYCLVSLHFLSLSFFTHLPVAERSLALLGLRLVFALDNQNAQALLSPLAPSTQRHTVHIDKLLGLLLGYGTLQGDHNFGPLKAGKIFWVRLCSLNWIHVNTFLIIQRDFRVFQSHSEVWPTEREIRHWSGCVKSVDLYALLI